MGKKLIILTEFVDDSVVYIKLVYRGRLWYGFDNIASRYDSRRIAAFYPIWTVIKRLAENRRIWRFCVTLLLYYAFVTQL